MPDRLLVEMDFGRIPKTRNRLGAIPLWYLPRSKDYKRSGISVFRLGMMISPTVTIL